MLLTPPEKSQFPTTAQVVKAWTQRLLPVIDTLIAQLIRWRQGLDDPSPNLEPPIADIPSPLGESPEKWLMQVFHDLRSPLQVVLGWAKQLQTTSVSPEVLERGLESIERSAELQTRLLDDLLDLYRFSLGKANLTLKPLDLALLIRSTCESLQLTASHKGVHLRHELPAQPMLVLGDTTRLQQILWNLIANAIKFTPAQGQVWVSGIVQAETVRVTIADTGQGIDLAFLPRIFEPYTAFA